MRMVNIFHILQRFRKMYLLPKNLINFFKFYIGFLFLLVADVGEQLFDKILIEIR